MEKKPGTPRPYELADPKLPAIHAQPCGNRAEAHRSDNPLPQNAAQMQEF